MSEYKRTFKLEGATLETAKTLYQEIESGQQKHSDLQDEFQQRYNDIMAKVQPELDSLKTEYMTRHDDISTTTRSISLELWSQIVSDVGVDIDPEKSFESSLWSIDATFLKDYNIAFLTESEQPSNPMGMIGVPPGATIN
jgi:hypothetical protein